MKQPIFFMSLLACLFLLPLISNGQKDTNSTGEHRNAPPREGGGKHKGGGGKGGGGNRISMEDSFSKTTGAYNQKGGTVTETNKTYSATLADQSGVVVRDSGTYSVKTLVIKKTGDVSNVEASGFYGINAGILALENATINVSDVTIDTDAEGSNAIFATGEKAVINVNNVVIKTSQNSSRGLDATRAAKINATKVSITTVGMHCAALATDRGGGFVNVNGGTLTTSGNGSPAIYSTGNISVNNVITSSTGSECAVIEGRNSVNINNSKLSGGKAKAFMIYQSFSGDAEIGTGHLTINGGSITALDKLLFYSTNTVAEIDLSQVEITNKEQGTIFFKAGADRWGRKGSNGAKATIRLKKQTIFGSVICDSISTCTLVLTEKSVWTGECNSAKTAQYCAVSLDDSSIWNVKADSYLNELTNTNKKLSNINSNGFNIYYDATNSANAWLASKTITLKGGGKLCPKS